MTRMLIILILLLSHLTMAEAESTLFGGKATDTAQEWQGMFANAMEGQTGRRYTVSRPLIYEDSWEKWPFAYLSDDGVPQGFNIELVKRVMRRLHIPFVIRLRNQEQVHHDLQRDSADLTFAVASAYNAQLGHFGKVTLCTFTNSMLVKREDSTDVITLEDLRNQKIIVRKGSRPYKYMLQHGFADSCFTVVDNMETEILREATLGIGGAIWNTTMMQWMLHKYNLEDRYVAVPIDMPDGEYRLMSQDTVLLAKADSVLMLMQLRGETERLYDEWATPADVDEDDDYVPIMLVLIFCTMAATIIYVAVRKQYSHYSRNTLSDIRRQMRLVLHSNKMKVWVYSQKTRRYAWMTSDGVISQYYTPFEFSRYYPDGNFNTIHSKVQEYLSRDMKPSTVKMRCYSITDPKKILDVEVRIQGLRDEYGKTYMVCGVQYDVTDSKAVIEHLRLLRQRYSTAFQMVQCIVLRFNGDRRLVGINDYAAERFGISDVDAFIEEGYYMEELECLNNINIDDLPAELRYLHRVVNCNVQAERWAQSKYFNPKPYAFRGYKGVNNEEQQAVGDNRGVGYYCVNISKSVDADGKPISYMLFLYDKTDEVWMTKDIISKRHQIRIMQDSKQTMLRRSRDYALYASGIWLVKYDPLKREFQIQDDNDARFQKPLSQVEMLEIVDADDIKTIFATFRKLDNFYRSDVTLDVRTYLINDKGQNRYFHLDLRPDYGHGGKIKSYFGTCRDVTEYVYTHQQLDAVTQQVAEADRLRGNFLRNTSYSLRQPLITIQENIRMLGTKAGQQNETDLIAGITTGVNRLTLLSEDTLLLSRIEAGMLNPRREPTDFCQLYRETVEKAINDFRSDSVQYTVQDVYDSLMLHCDPTILRRILYEIVTLSARYTRLGTLAVHYIYHKDTLTFVVEDTGQGIPPSIFSRIYEPHIGEEFMLPEYGRHLTGLEIPICKALIDMVGGEIDIDSDTGRGTNIYVKFHITKAEG